MTLPCWSVRVPWPASQLPFGLTPYRDRRPHAPGGGQSSNSRLQLWSPSSGTPNSGGLSCEQQRIPAPGTPPCCQGWGRAGARPAASQPPPSGPAGLCSAWCPHHARPQRSARNPEQHSWVGEGRAAALGHRVSPAQPIWGHRGRRCSRRFNAEPPAQYRDLG